MDNFLGVISHPSLDPSLRYLKTTFDPFLIRGGKNWGKNFSVFKAKKFFADFG